MADKQYPPKFSELIPTNKPIKCRVTNTGKEFKKQFPNEQGGVDEVTSYMFKIKIVESDVEVLRVGTEHTHFATETEFDGSATSVGLSEVSEEDVVVAERVETTNKSGRRYYYIQWSLPDGITPKPSLHKNTTTNGIIQKQDAYAHTESEKSYEIGLRGIVQAMICAGKPWAIIADTEGDYNEVWSVSAEEVDTWIRGKAKEMATPKTAPQNKYVTATVDDLPDDGYNPNSF